MQAIKIAIPEPCHENWHEMTPTDQGKFCKACVKEVVDFTTMTDSEVLNFFTKKVGTNVCGNVYPGQLNRTITKPVTVSQKITWYWKYIVATILLFTKGSAHAQKNNVRGGIRPRPSCEIPVKGKMAPQHLRKDTTETYKGRIVDTGGIAVPYASIVLKGTNIGVTSDSNGNFSISINKNATKIFEVSYVGFATKEVLLSQTNVESNVIVLEKRYLSLPGGISVIAYTPVKAIPIVQINVLDKNSKNFVVGALIDVQKNENKLKSIYSDVQGVAAIEKIKKIKQSDIYTFLIKAKGYKPYKISLSGEDFIDNNIQNIYLELDKTVSAKINIIKTTPNPISKGSSFTINLQLFEPGNYYLQIIDVSGNALLNKNVQAFTKTCTVPMMAESNWSSGIYFIKLVTGKNEVAAEDSFLIQ